MSEEPLVFPGRVPVLQQLFDDLLGVFPLAGLLEGVGADGALEALELQSVTGGEKMGVVDRLESKHKTMQLLSTRHSATHSMDSEM